MSHNCSDHLHPNEVGMEDLQPLLIWSKDKKLLDKYVPYIRDEFLEHIFLLDIDTLNHTLDLEDDNLEYVLEEYDFHLIKITDSRLELILTNSEKYEQEGGDIAVNLEHYVRKVIEWGRKNSTL